jgi:quinol monooxygenase YgiN
MSQESAYVLTATIIAKDGDEDAVGALLRECVAPSLGEPGVVTYELSQSSREPRRFFVYEVYRDRVALDAHGNSDHVQRLIVGDVVPRAESVDIVVYRKVL